MTGSGATVSSKYVLACRDFTAARDGPAESGARSVDLSTSVGPVRGYVLDGRGEDAPAVRREDAAVGLAVIVQAAEQAGAPTTAGDVPQPDVSTVVVPLRRR